MEWLTPPPVAVGARMAFVAHFLGRRLGYTYEVRALVPGARLVTSTAEGPFPMETTYTWSAEGEKTRITLRNRGEPTGFAGVVAPVMARMMRRANQADLAKLKALLESRLGVGPLAVEAGLSPLAVGLAGIARRAKAEHHRRARRRWAHPSCRWAPWPAGEPIRSTGEPIRSAGVLLTIPCALLPIGHPMCL